MVRSDHPSNSKRGGACIYYKETYIPLRVINVNYLNECIRFELNIGEKLCSFISLYRSPIQTQDEFDTFTDNLILNLDLAVQSNPYLVAVLGDFNGKLKTWYGCYKTNFERKVLETPFSRFGLHQMINNSTHISDTYRVPVHKKGDKLCLKNYRSVSRLTVCGKILEKLIFDKMFQFFIKNELISTNQSVQASRRWIIPYANATQT